MIRNDVKKESEWNIRIGSQRNLETDHAKKFVVGFSIFRVQESDGHCNGSFEYAQVKEVLNRLFDDSRAVRLGNEH